VRALTASVVAGLFLTGAVAAPGVAAKPAWHRCQKAMSLCDGRGRVVFPYVWDYSMSSGYRSIVSGFRKTGARSAIADTRGDWYIKYSGDCGEFGDFRDCTEYEGLVQIRYATADAGRHWRPVRAHRVVHKLQGPGPDPPPVVGTVDDNPPLDCTWSHMSGGDQVPGPSRTGFGTWCSPEQAWTIPDSLLP